MKKLIAVLAAFGAVALVVFLIVDDDRAGTAGARAPVAPFEAAGNAAADDGASRTPTSAPMTEIESESESETEVVMGLRVRKDRNCTLEKNVVSREDGSVYEAITCEPDDPVENGYANHTDAELLVLSYAEAGAAEELGKRLLFQDRFGPAHDMMLRAVALEPRDTGPLLYIVNTEGSLRGDSREAIDAVATAYIVTKTASYFDETLTTAWIEPDLSAYNFTSKDIAKLDEIVERNLQRMREVQIEVFGDSMIGEDL